jgi:hypothetical protein
MLCLTLWFSLTEGLYTNLNSKHVQGGFEVDVVSKLGNKYLGQIHVNTKLCLMNRLNDMQRQASCLMRHATRFPRDVLFWVEDKELLPRNFAYKTNLEPQEEAHVKQRLEQAKQAGLLSMMWNEDDSWAEQQTSRLPINIYNDQAWIGCRKDTLRFLSKSLLFLENKGVTEWHFSYDGQTSHVVRQLGFLREACACQEVVIAALCGIQLVRSSFSGPKMQVLLLNAP